MWTSLVEVLRRAAADLRSRPDGPLFDSIHETRAGLGKFIAHAADQIEELARVFVPTGDWDDTSRNRALADEVFALLAPKPQPVSPDAAALAAMRRRLGLADMAVYVEDARREMAAEGSPEWVVLFAGQPLPNTMRHWMRVRVSVSPEPWATVETRSAPAWICSESSGVDDLWGPVNGVVVHHSELEPAQALELFHLLSGASEHDLTHVLEDRPVLDGYFCKLTVVRKNPWRITEVRFTLSSISEKMRGQPAVKLVRAVLQHRARIPG